MLDWAWAYWTFNRYARIVTEGLDKSTAPRAR